MTSQGERTGVRLAELVAALSLGIDLGFNQPMEHVLRQCLISLRMAERIGLSEEDRATVYYTALMINVGCHSDAHEQAKWMGDDIALKGDKYLYGTSPSVKGIVKGMSRIGMGAPVLQRFRIGVGFFVTGMKELGNDMIAKHAAIAKLLAQQLGLPQAVMDGVGAAYEKWDGKGWPGELKGADIPIAARLAPLGEFTEVAARVGGVDAVRKLMAKESGKLFDPELAAIMSAEAELITAGLEDAGNWDAVIDLEPSLSVVLTGERFDAALEAVANFIDLKSPYFSGHAKTLSALVASAAEGAGWPDDEVQLVRRAALVQGFGRLGVSNAIWDKKGRLGAGEFERVRMHPYLCERMLNRSDALAPLAAIVVQHRERLDGSGYPRGLAGNAISKHARLLGAADAYQAMREPRPHREALSAEDAAAALRDEVAKGRLDGSAVDAVLTAAGHRVQRRREGPAGLTVREVEVLQLAARGLSNKEIAAKLVISPKTVSNHIEHIYVKIGATSRATACLFAMQNGLLPEDTAPIE